jgi:undecaprenyl-diphosphatase
MDIIRAIILGIIQALTEFLPISSSAHLILAREWVGLDSVDGLTFDVAVHFGTLIAVMIFFRRDLVRVAASVLQREADPADRRIAMAIVVGTLPAVILGVAFAEIIENVLRTPSVIVATLVAGALLFLVIERVCKPTQGLESMSIRSGFLIGVAQSIALIPGVSRSGITTIAGMTRNLKRADAARFSFLLGVPVMLGACAKKALDLPGLSLDASQAAVLAAGAVSAGIAGWFTIRSLLRFLQHHRLDAFAFYRVALAVVVLLTILL